MKMRLKKRLENYLHNLRELLEFKKGTVYSNPFDAYQRGFKWVRDWCIECDEREEDCPDLDNVSCDIGKLWRKVVTGE